MPFTLKYLSARSEYFTFPKPILKDEYVSHTSLYNGSCNRLVHTNRPDAPISGEACRTSYQSDSHHLTMTYHPPQQPLLTMAPLTVVGDYSTGAVWMAALLTSPPTVSLPTPVSVDLPHRLEDPGQFPRGDVDKAPSTA